MYPRIRASSMTDTHRGGETLKGRRVAFGYCSCAMASPRNLRRRQDKIDPYLFDAPLTDTEARAV